jgi:hypothetical protein
MHQSAVGSGSTRGSAGVNNHQSNPCCDTRARFGPVIGAKMTHKNKTASYVTPDMFPAHREHQSLLLGFVASMSFNTAEAVSPFSNRSRNRTISLL